MKLYIDKCIFFFFFIFWSKIYFVLNAVPVLLTLSCILRCCKLSSHVRVYEPIENIHVLLNVTHPTHVFSHFAILYLQFTSQRYLNYCLYHCLIFLFQLNNKVLDLSHHHHQQFQNFWDQFFFWFGHFLMIYPIEKAQNIISKVTLSWKHICKYT